MLIEYLQQKPRQIHTMCRYLGVNIRTVYRYLKLFEAVGYMILKDKNNKIKLEKKIS